MVSAGSKRPVGEASKAPRIVLTPDSPLCTPPDTPATPQAIPSRPVLSTPEMLDHHGTPNQINHMASSIAPDHLSTHLRCPNTSEQPVEHQNQAPHPDLEQHIIIPNVRSCWARMRRLLSLFTIGKANHNTCKRQHHQDVAIGNATTPPQPVDQGMPLTPLQRKRNNKLTSRKWPCNTVKHLLPRRNK